MNDETSPNLARRRLLKGLFGFGATAIAGDASAAPLRFLKPLHVENPLANYPNRDWEKAYRNIFKPDSSFVFLCAPNDTHNCLLRAYVKNGVVARIGPTFGYGKAEDLYGNRASPRWDPRICQKGLALVRRIYGDRRVKSPMVRKGYMEWVRAGFPRDATTGRPDAKYFQRGRDKWLRVSWDEAYRTMALALDDIMRTYSGPQGAARLTAQGYDSEMVDALHGAGTQTIKVRGGMAFLGATRVFGLYRVANALALSDAKIRGVKPEEAVGARGWDSYSWHTDLPPGHPMVTGAQTNDFDLFAVEHSKLCVVWGMNWITTKMPDSHWLTEARLKGTKVVAVTVEYSATASKADDVIIIRPGTDPAFALGLAQVIMSRKLYDEAWIQKNTDLPFLVRMDDLTPLRPEHVDASYAAAPHANITILKAGEKPTPVLRQRGQLAAADMAPEFGGFMVWDRSKKSLAVVTRDDAGADRKGVDAQLRYAGKVKLADGRLVEVRTSFDLLAQYLDENMTPALVEKITGAPARAVVHLAEEIAKNPEKTLFPVGMGPNQFFNADLKDRAILLVAALTRNIGFPGGNVGSYAGNYRAALFGGMPSYVMEDPFELQLDPKAPAKSRKTLKYESLHYFNYGERPLRLGNKMFTGAGHMPTPTKAMWLNNSNSVIGNVKWHYDVVVNTLPKLELIAYADWWWTGSCEYSDIVFACDSWAEFKAPDMTGSCTNPFVQMFPRSPLTRLFDTRGDVEILSGVMRALAKVQGEPRLADVWKHADDGNVEAYLQRIIDNSPALAGYNVGELIKRAEQGVPALMNNRTYPRISSFEQARGEQPWHTKSGRLEFYRHEREFIEHGENLVVHREPVDSTFYEPNVIVARPHPALRPRTPRDYGLDPRDVSTETRQVRNIMIAPEDLLRTKHPLVERKYSHIYHTPKYRHGAHTTPVDTDYTGVLFGPFGDVYRHDKRLASVVEAYVDINPRDARAVGVDDGDYVWIEADPSDRPFRGAQPGTEEHKVAKLLLRARYYPGTPRGVLRTWHNMYGATFGSVRGHEGRADGLAKNPETNYQAMYRYGSHQSATRAWLRPTLMTDTLVHKDMFGQMVMRGFAADIHCPVGAPREAFVKVTRAELGGIGGVGQWRPVTLGLRPTYESTTMKTYLQGGYISARRGKRGS